MGFLFLDFNVAIKDNYKREEKQKNKVVSD